MHIKKDKESSLFIAAQACSRCQQRFKSQIPEIKTETKWSVIRIPRYCLKCEASREEIQQAIHHDELKNSLSQGQLVEYHAQTDIDRILTLPMLVLQDRLREGKRLFTPLDWWHIHYEKVLKRMGTEGWNSPSKSVLVEHKSNGQLAPWLTSLGRLPFSALLELFLLGEIKTIANALGRFRLGCSEERQQLFDMARARLGVLEPRARFEALYLLLLLEPKSSLLDCIGISKDEQEHPRLRGLALEGISEAFDIENSLADEVLELLERLPSSSNPEIRWWSAYAIGHLPQIYDVDGELMDNYHLPLLKALDSIVDDPRPAGLGWAVGKEAQDAITSWQGGEVPERPRALAYDPWGVI